MKKRNISFKDVYKIYEFEDEVKRKEWVWNNAPLHEVILDMVVKHLPNPIEAQAYRIPKIWNGDKESHLGKDLLTCNKNGKLAFVVTRIIIDPAWARKYMPDAFSLAQSRTAWKFIPH